MQFQWKWLFNTLQEKFYLQKLLDHYTYISRLLTKDLTKLDKSPVSVEMIK